MYEFTFFVSSKRRAEQIQNTLEEYEFDVKIDTCGGGWTVKTYVDNMCEVLLMVDKVNADKEAIEFVIHET